MRPALLALTLALGACGLQNARYAAQEVALDQVQAARALGAYRAANGLKPLAYDAQLGKVAAAQARRNAEIGELSHDAGGAFPVRLAAYGAADRGRAAENLAMGAASIDEAIAQWKASPHHNRNLLLAEAKSFGLARADAPDSRGKRYWALVVGD